MVEVAKLDQLLDVVGHVRAEIVAAGPQLAGRQLGIADIVEQQGLHAVDVVPAAALELVLDDVEQTAMQTLNQREGLKIKRLHVEVGITSLGNFRSLDARFHGISRLLCVGQDLSPGPLLKNTICRGG